MLRDGIKDVYKRKCKEPHFAERCKMGLKCELPEKLTLERTQIVPSLTNQYPVFYIGFSKTAIEF